MSKVLTLILMLTIVGAGVFWYRELYAVCRTPITYSVGHLDNRFKLTIEEAKEAVAVAEAVWEDAVGKDLFQYQEADGKLTVNFLFDERQEFVDAAEREREKLDEAEAVNEQVEETYTRLFGEYQTLENAYLARIAAYERDLNQFNETVAVYDEQGGVPPEEFNALKKQQQQLDREAGEINAIARQLNHLSEQINEVSAEGNELIERYNDEVLTYNNTFGESHEFTQGDYVSGTISIYKFSDERELTTVLAHELGHALKIGHVEGEESVMYYLMGKQPEELMLTQADIEAYRAVCEAPESWRSFLPFINTN